MTTHLMLDSGAFSVWSKGHHIDLEAYIAYCREFSDVTYYVNLDVIPGVANDRFSRNKETIERACRAGWDNYWMMVNELEPSQRHKIVPVFHQHDDFKWLEKYLNHGVRYIGISPANDSSPTSKRQWLASVKPFIFDKAGRPLVKTHGFAVTSYDLMNFWHWHSVDSASWKLVAAWGGIYVPRYVNGKWSFSTDPLIVAVSPMSPLMDAGKKREYHALSMSPQVLDQVQEFLDYIGLGFGIYKILKVKKGHKLKDDELWYVKDGKELPSQRNSLGGDPHHKSGPAVLKIVEKGVATSFEERAKATSRFMKLAAKEFPVDHLYFAGAPMPYALEYKLGHRLLSFDIIGKSRSHNCILKHLRTMKGPK